MKFLLFWVFLVGIFNIWVFIVVVLGHYYLNIVYFNSLIVTFYQPSGASDTK